MSHTGAGTAFQIVSQDPRFVVIDKSPGISMHKDDQAAGLAMRLEQALGQKVWPVHRLDRMTSGLVVFALSAEMAAELSAAFAEQQVSKLYLALSDRKPVKKQGRIEGGMARSRRSSWRLTRDTENFARTEFYSASIKPGLRAFLCRPYTGKTHQIRVALKSVGAPIIGDPVYHEKVEQLSDRIQPDRGYLHAWQLRFALQGETFAFRADPTLGSLFNLPELADLLSTDWSDPFSLRWHGASN
ncbi:TIGR01621 family pseudouridine synthase [Marinobacterium sediminicola]|uniref:tRNA pseudouridine32 synthase / 23S rRNA pseudouridine746 synthase n=1 Tax=Marinobacterium sediminicola TaxID=518898 RepID=A0ABY1RW88_9GAMM|nr:TIGR01621 family pseudouridine synthase [Marinobacterium sediminicola]ULG70396.1 TIGR01621 family pseudouridine synthase [Marinobacterium sediminicola]SMR69491.1 tRNA pseudouridine32 synthase / 23S rRNA pseudouridine746 synthase [Marinobacterium sediminicola]